VLSGLQFLRDRFVACGDTDALIWQGRASSYAWLLRELDAWRQRLSDERIVSGDVVSLTAEFSPASAAALLALLECGCIVVPLTRASDQKRDEFIEIAQAGVDITVRPDDSSVVSRFERTAQHPLYQQLRATGHPGLVLFSSGSSGRSKAVLHDGQHLIEKFKTPRQARRTIAFLSFDHIGGVNTLLHVLSNGGTVITVSERTPAAVCDAIERHRVQILPTSPTFLNLLLMSDALDRFDLSALETITYGTEVMPEGTLARLRERVATATLLQTYGLSEVGILRSKSESSESLWVKVGGEGVETRIVDGMLQIKSHSAMLGYLNAPSPFTDDGWFMTGDLVDERDGFLRIHGRQSDIINVGGEKVFPAEVEDVLQRLDGVADAVVYGEPNAIVGNIVVAKVNLTTNETAVDFRKRLVQFCRQYLQPYKVPQRVVLSSEPLHSDRFKRVRFSAGAQKPPGS
jgi:acyl-coenzyme A synthetase/AMP-(fatty) acid ligase